MTPDSQKRVVEAKLMKGKGNISQLLARWEVTPADGGTPLARRCFSCW